MLPAGSGVTEPCSAAIMRMQGMRVLSSSLDGTLGIYLACKVCSLKGRDKLLVFFENGCESLPSHIAVLRLQADKLGRYSSLDPPPSRTLGWWHYD